MAAVGVFDSGLGGLTVLQALRARLPGEDFLYFADTHYLPYGDRPESFLRERSKAVADALLGKGVKALVIACNTATAAAAESVRAHVPVPVVALEPPVKPAAEMTRIGRVGVMATTRTLGSSRFARLVSRHAAQVTVVTQACPGLAEAIEQEGPESAAVSVLLDGYVAPLAEAGVDVVALGCTHYPWVREQIAARMPPGTQLVESGAAVARQLQRVLTADGLLGGGHGQLSFLTSGPLGMLSDTLARLWPVAGTREHWNP